MSDIEIAIGADVRSRDGRSIGKVEHLIIDGRSNELSGFVADKGIFDSGRVVDLIHVASASREHVDLKLTDDEAKTLPGFVQHEFFRFGGDTQVNVGAGTMMDVGSSGSTWVHYGPGVGGGMPSTGASSLYGPSVVGDVSAQVVGPLTESDIVLDHGTDVVDVNGEKIGKVDDVHFDEKGKVSGFVVREGLLFHHDVSVPLEWIAGITHEHVRLNVAKDEVERSKR
jgi:uncharacterized protein YrrD